jgi:hypothetical protein
MAKKPKNPQNQVINNIKVIVNGEEAKAHRKQAARGRLLDKIDDRQPLPPEAAPEDTVEKPKDLNLGNLTHFSSNCTANNLVSADWSQDPMVRFYRRTKEVHFHGKDGYCGTLYCDSLRFNDWAFRRLGLRLGMKLALLTDCPVAPRYLVIQNVVRGYEAPAHRHRLGTFTLTRGVALGDEAHTHLCKPGTKTFIGVVGHTRYGRYPMSLFESFPHLSDHQMRLYRMEGEPDAIVGFFQKVGKVPERLADKLRREGVPMLESDHRPYNPARDTVKSG